MGYLRSLTASRIHPSTSSLSMRISALLLLPLGLVAVAGRPTNDVNAAHELAAEGGTFDMSQADMLDKAKNGYAVSI